MDLSEPSECYFKSDSCFDYGHIREVVVYALVIWWIYELVRKISFLRVWEQAACYQSLNLTTA